MRTLSGALLAEQKKSSYEAEVATTIGGTSYTARLKKVRHIERPYGGRATVLLRNDDKGITADLRGLKVSLSYGFTSITGSTAAPLWVLTQRDISEEGVLTTELDCIDIWLKMSLLTIIGGGGKQLTGTITGTFQPGMKVTGLTSGAQGTIVYVGSTYIAVARVARTFTVGETVKADLDPAITIVLTAATDFGGGSAPAWNGDKTVLQIIQQLLTGVATVVLDSSDGIVDVYKPYYTTENNARILDIVEDLMNLTKCGIRMGSGEQLHIFSVATTPGSPHYTYSSDHAFFSDIRDVSQILPNRIIVINALPTDTTITTYAGSAEDTAAKDKLGMYVTQVIVSDIKSDADGNIVAASRLLRIQMEAVRGTIIAPMNCGQELFDYIRCVDARAGIDYYGWIGALEHVWEPGTYQLTIELGGLMGAEGINPKEEFPLPNIDNPLIPPFPQSPIPIPDLTFLPAYLPVVIDGDFYSNAYNKVYWSAGTIKAADGTTFSYNARSSGSALTLANSDFYYLYHLIGNPTLQVTQTFGNTVGADRILVAILLQNTNTESDSKALIIPAKGGRSLSITGGVISANAITADKCAITELAAITANMGLLTAGEIRVGTGTLGSNYTGWRLWLEGGIGRIAGYSSASVNPQWYSGTDGKLYAGGGAVILDTGGIKIFDESHVMIYRTGSPNVWCGYISANSAYQLLIVSPNGDLVLASSAGNILLNAPWPDKGIDASASDFMILPVRTAEPILANRYEGMIVRNLDTASGNYGEVMYWARNTVGGALQWWRFSLASTAWAG